MFNRKGQFSIIAALLVAVVLIGATVTTYSAIRYNSNQEQQQPQIISAIDETNLGLKEILGFTVGYYGSVLKVTGNMSYAQQLATSYLRSGLNNLGQIQPEWGTSFELTSLTVNASWFSNQSYSQGSLSVNYNLTGLGIFGASYTTSTRLDVQISPSNQTGKAQLMILRDEGQPLINLGKRNLQLYSYNYVDSVWQLTDPLAIASTANGTYILDLPSGVPDSAYIIQVQDTRGLMVLASAATAYTSTVAWNATGFRNGVYDYVDSANSVVGVHSYFPDQQGLPDGFTDTLSEEVYGTYNLDYYPSSINLLGSTTIQSGTVSQLQSDGGYLDLQAYPTAYSSAYNTITVDDQSSAVSSSGSSMSWTHTTGIGNDRILLISIDTFSNSGTPATVSSVTYDGTPLTSPITDYYSTSPRVRSYVYTLYNPTVGTKTISVTFSGSTSAIGGSITYFNVNQTATITSNTAKNSGTSQTVSVNAVGTTSKVLFGHLGAYRTNSYTITDSQTTQWSQTSQQYKGFGSDKTVTSGAVSTSWTTSSAASWVAIALLLQPSQVATAYACSAEFLGASNLLNWNNIVWTIDGRATTNGVSVSYQLYNYQSGQYPITGNGYLTDTLTTSDRLRTQTIAASPTNFRDGSGNWKINITATYTSAFNLNLDLVQYRTNQDNYALNLEEQWLDVNATNVRQDLCIKTGALSAEALIVEVLNGGTWQPLMTLNPNTFNNITLIPYINSNALTIRFVGGNDATDPTPNNWNIDSVYIKDEPDVNYLVNQQQSTLTIETLQNGTMRWLGQNLQVTTQTLPIPPIPVKSLHVNQTINGVNQEVPFQIEDWASNYQVPLSLTSNSTVFSNRQMIVFLINSHVSDFTIWWDGRDTATQTSYAYTNRFFTNDNTATSTLTNGNVTLLFGSFNVKATVGGTSDTATFMRMNGEASSYGAGLAYVIHHGIVRDVIQQEAEWNTGAPNCPNLYANIILTLPANSTYYTYQLRLMFINSAQARTITNFSPIKLVPTNTTILTQTENSTLIDYFPIIQSGTGVFSNYAPSGTGTVHHFSQFIASDTGKGSGIMYTDKDTQRLYAFNAIAGQSTGALNVAQSSPLIELTPVNLAQAQFTYAYDVTWCGAVATFDGTTPICRLYDGTTPTGLFLLAAAPPTLTLTAKS
jgi:hypothetical protein